MESVLWLETEEAFNQSKDHPHLLCTLQLTIETLARMHLKLEKYLEYLITGIII